LKHVEDVKLHLLQAGFKPNYWYWTCHGESDPELLAEINKKKSAQEGHSSHHSRFLNMVYDAVGPQHQMECEEEMEESSNINDQSFTTYYMRHRNNCGLDATITQNCLLPLDY
jgi:hypothetical protein